MRLIDQLIVSLSIVLSIIGIFCFIAAAKKGESAIKDRPYKRSSFTTEVCPQEALKVIIRYALQTDYMIEALDENQRWIVLGKPVTFTSWGFFFPIWITNRGDKKTLIDVGIQSKAGQIGVLVSRTHERFFNGIKAAFLVKL
ncbi:MAG: hypothetical protein RIE73_09475 [Coleofasciculus sp. C1-SOL-03]|jgi:hypothetical protein|uniref:hypothetical protein n=1 Tax=Coleofasciculus sp. C1-SOL-03 TaxID=3069522 RepID=UPI0032FB634C